MENIYIIVFSFTIILILHINHLLYHNNTNKYERKNYFFVVITILLFGLVNLLLLNHIEFNKIKILLILLGMSLIPSTIIGIYIYIKTKLNKFFLKNFKFSIIYFLIIFPFLFLYYSSGNIISISINLNFLELFENKLYFIIIIIPLIELIIYMFYKTYRKEIKFSGYLFLATLFPIVGFVLDIFFDTCFLIPSYVLSLLCLDLYNNLQIANFDSLTGLYNRSLIDYGHFDKRLSLSKKIGMFLIDVDKFKNINDTYGHIHGDTILKDISSILKNSIRNSDIAIRYGGDEFLLIAAIRKKSDLKIIEEKIISALNEYNLKLNQNYIPVSLSIGYDIYDFKIELKDFIEKIDKKMYEKKAKTRLDN